MRIARFGDTYAAGYEFSKSLMDDSWQSARPPKVQAVSGASGAFDFYGSNNYPVAPVLANKKFAITSSVSSAAIEDSLITLRAATIAADRSKLWWLDRDDSTKYWSWAKCIRLKASDTYKERGKWLKNVDIGFYMSEGLWYGETEQIFTRTIPIATIFTQYSVTNNGNFPATVNVQVTPAAGTMTATVVDSATIQTVWEFTGNVANPNFLEVQAQTYEALYIGADAYSDLVVGFSVITGGDYNQVAWLQLDSGSNAVKLGRTPTTMNTEFILTWWDTYVF